MGNSNIPPKEALREICLYGGNGDEEKVKEILKKNPHLLNEELNSHDSTILIYASIHNKIQIIKLLLSYDSININHQTNYGYTALHWACYYGRKDIVELLLSHSNIDINIKDEKGRLASDVCCDGYVANISIKPSILALLKSHSKTKAVLTPSPITTIKHSNEGSLSSNTVIPQPTLKESSIVEEVKDRELLTVVEEKESLKLQIEGLEETIREITNNNMNEMERLLQEKENYMKEVDTMKKNRNEIVTMLQENNKLMVDQLLSEMKKALNNAERQIDEKEKRCQRLEDQVVRMEDRFEERMKSMENIINNLESRLCEKEKESVKLEDQMIRMEDKFEVRIKQMEVSQKETVRAMQLKPLPLPPNKQTHVFLTHTWREDEKGRNNHDRVGRVNEALRKRGLVTWFDSERMSGTVRQAMTDALDATCCVLIFITKKYEEKVNSKNEADNCYFEFNVAAHDTYLANMRIPIVMEECMLNEKGWQGRLKTEMGHQLYFDLSSDDKDVFEERCNEVFVRVVKLLNI